MSLHAYEVRRYDGRPVQARAARRKADGLRVAVCRCRLGENCTLQPPGMNAAVEAVNVPHEATKPLDVPPGWLGTREARTGALWLIFTCDMRTLLERVPGREFGERYELLPPDVPLVDPPPEVPENKLLAYRLYCGGAHYNPAPRACVLASEAKKKHPARYRAFRCKLGWLPVRVLAWPGGRLVEQVHAPGWLLFHDDLDDSTYCGFLSEDAFRREYVERTP